jgi:hypothetical protein
MRSFVTACLAIALVASFASVSRAAECRSLASVAASAQSIAANKTSGGHVSIHIKGEATQADKTQYDSEADFRRAFANWRGLSETRIATLKLTPKSCSGSGDLIDMVPARAVGIHEIWFCQGVERGTNRCNEGQGHIADNVCFTYHLASRGWALWTSYPILRCQLFGTSL